jgi:Flp pilus assembly protein TadD
MGRRNGRSVRANGGVREERTVYRPDGELDPIEGLIFKSRKLRRRGDTRGAILLLRQACSQDEWRARTFTLLGVLLSEVGRHDEAAKALTHARWLRQRAGEGPRAAVTARLLEAALAAR